MVAGAASVVAAGVFVLVAAAPAGSAQADDLTFTLSVGEVDGTTVVHLGRSGTPLSTLTGAVTFDRDVLGEATCEPLAGFGACNDRGGRIEFALIALPPLRAPLDVVSASFERQRFDGAVELRLVDVAATTATGEELTPTTIDGSVIGKAGSPSSARVWVAAIALGALLVGLVGFGPLRRRTR